MVGSKYLITSDPECSKNVQTEVDRILSELGYPSTPVKFVAGTMFMCRSKLLKPFKDHYTIKDFAPTDGNIKDGTGDFGWGFIAAKNIDSFLQRDDDSYDKSHNTEKDRDDNFPLPEPEEKE